MILCDIINLTPTTIVKKETANAIPVNPSQRTERKILTISNDSITETEPNVNTNDKRVLHCRKQDGEWNELSDEHHEVFKQSEGADSKTHYRLSSNPYT